MNMITFIYIYLILHVQSEAFFSEHSTEPKNNI
jgi:hypothetical protein